MRTLIFLLTLSLSTPVFSGGSRNFDGSNDEISINNGSELEIEGTAITLMCWFNSNSSGQSSGGRALSKRTDAGGSDVYALYAFEDRIRFRLDGTDLISDNTFTTQVWTHVAGVYDGTDTRIYWNGVLDGVTPASKTDAIDASARAVFLGVRELEGTDRRWFGELVDVRIYNVALTSSEISTASKCFNLPIRGLVGHWLLTDVGTGPTFVDISPSTNNGTNVGTTESNDGPPTRWCAEVL